jgi:hypothetical protein
MTDAVLWVAVGFTLDFLLEMEMRYVFTTLFAALGLMGLASTSLAEAPAGDDVQMLFVQSATGGSYDGKTLTLNGIPSTTYFSDRPKRIVGHVDSKRFVDQWAQGKDSFKADPPNAVLSVLGKDGANDSAIELSNPQISGNQISYQVKVLKGKPPAKFHTASLFIDGHAGAFIGGMVAGSLLSNMRN